jgi:hypothetical protein
MTCAQAIVNYLDKLERTMSRDEAIEWLVSRDVFSRREVERALGLTALIGETTHAIS